MESFTSRQYLMKTFYQTGKTKKRMGNFCRFLDEKDEGLEILQKNLKFF